MGRKEKLIEKLQTSGNMTFDEVEALLGLLSFQKNNKGKTSGSRVMFVHDELGVKIILHKPHPQKELKVYQIKQLRDLLNQEGLI